MGSKPSTTARRTPKYANDNNAEPAQKKNNTDQKEQPQPIAAKANPSKAEETGTEVEEDEETGTVVPIPRRKVAITKQISIAKKDDDGRKQVNQ